MMRASESVIDVKAIPVFIFMGFVCVLRICVFSSSVFVCGSFV